MYLGLACEEEFVVRGTRLDDRPTETSMMYYLWTSKSANDITVVGKTFSGPKKRYKATLKTRQSVEWFQ